jgi:hypothetical protein
VSAICSPARVIGTRYERISGAPNAHYASTSFAERHNLTMQMQMGRLTRLTNAFSKKFDNHCHALSLYFVWYNFVKIHKAHKLTPAIAAGVMDKLWSVEDIAALVDAAAPKPGKARPVQKAGRLRGVGGGIRTPRGASLSPSSYSTSSNPSFARISGLPDLAPH